MAVRLIDVARAANVSRSTASNVFTNPERVRPPLRAQVEAAAKALGYAGPDPKARLLRAGKVNAVGVVVPGQWGVADTLRSPVFVQFLQGVAKACDKAGASIVLLPDAPGISGVASAVVDGFIFGRIGQMEQLQGARRRKLPFAVVDFNAGPEVNAVLIDAHAGAKAAVKHLLDLGHRRFGFISFIRGSGPTHLIAPGPGRDLSKVGLQIDQEKLRGAAEALEEAGLSLDSMPILNAQPWDDSAAGLILDEAPQVTAIFAFSAMQAIAVIREAKQREIRVPADISVVGYNDIPAAAQCNPPLTTLDSQPVEKGRIAAEFVLAGERGRQQYLAPRFIVRQSTGPAPLSTLRRTLRV